ncbi:MAG: VWA domain-containing protein [Gammaproteobacteria bacterium]|nr:VWA domain-containing protein [Gammaproteobacteria bacterium]MDH4313973.1 VWA domain-containing protein [Gammaproteobacteria bacterium]MDH5212707.1 VWA domain-containing protein [Gammaproteobacteria bacterium]
MNISVQYPWVLLLLVSGIVPLITRETAPVRYSTFTVLPPDTISNAAAIALRLARSASLVLLIIGLSGPYLPEKEVERIGEGAQIILLLDRSRSMDQPFGGQPFKNPLLPAGGETKGTVSRRLLSEFVADRRNDKYGMLVFSTEPIQVLPLTDKTEIIQAAIEAGNIGRGLSETNVGPGIIDAIRFFEDKSYTGSRVILLVSDGGARLDVATRIQIADLLKRFRIALYWIYIRSRNSPGIVASRTEEKRDDIAPARVLHEFFETLETPYRAFDAEDPSALAAAIAEVNELQSLPIQYIDIIQRKNIAIWFYAAAMALVSVLLIADRTEIRRW